MSHLQFHPAYLHVLSCKHRGRRWFSGVLPLGREMIERITESIQFVDGVGWRLPEDLSHEIFKCAALKTTGRRVPSNGVTLIGYAGENYEKVIIPVV